MNTIKTLGLMAAITLTVGVNYSNAATILYDFTGATPTAFDYSGAVLTAAATSNDFGSGITASVYSFSGSTSGRGISFGGGEARAMLGTNVQTHSFTIAIPLNVTVDLTDLSFTSGTIFAENSWTLAISKGTPSAIGGNPITGTASGRRTAENAVTLAGLSGLTNESVTFTITDTTGRNNNTEAFYSFIDNVTLTGTAASVPEPSTSLLGALGALVLLRRRRKNDNFSQQARE